MKAAMMLSIFDGKPPPAGTAPSSGRPNAGEILTPRTPLLLRGHTMGRSAVADGERRGSGISHSALALLPGSSAAESDSSLQAASSAGGASLRRESSIRLPAFNMNNMLAAGDDELDGLLTHRSGGQSSRLATTREAADHELTTVVGLPLSVAVTPQQRAPLVLQAALALWLLRDEARGFRKWKDVLAEPLDLSAQLPALPTGVTSADEARRLLLNAETKRQIAMVRHQSSSSIGKKASGGQAQAAASFSRAESNLLVLWAREVHAKSFRDVDDLTLREVVRHLRLRQYQDGEPLFFEGDAGDQFYLLLDGTVAVYSGASAAVKHRPPASRPGQAQDGKPAAVEDLSALGRRVFTYRAGESFGETSMFTKDAARTASAVAAGACEVLELAKGVYLRTLKRFHRQYYERARRLHFAQRVPLFREWPRPRVAAVAEALELRKLSFGDRLLVEGVVAPAACFLVLSGALKLTTQVALDDADDGDEHRSSQGGGASSPRRQPPDSSCDGHAARSRKRPEQRRGLVRRGGAAITIALHSARAGEFVALEAVLHPGSRARYSAVADTADVEVYALAESDARALLGGAGSVVYQQLRLMADAAAKQHRQRLDAARRALQDRRQPPLGLARLDEGGFCDAGLLGGGDGGGDHLEGAVQTPAESEREQEQRQRSRAVAAEHTTYVPHLDTSRLLAAATGASASLGSVAPCSPLLSPDGKWLGREDKVDPDVSAVAPPRMLSTCVKNFVFANSDTLASDYVERLALQFPLASPRQPHAFLLSTSPDGGDAAASVTARPTESPSFGSPNHHHRRTRPQQQQQQQQLLGQHMRRLYETKMHWDASRKSFVLVPPPATDPAAPGSACAATPTKARSATASTSLGAEPLYRQQREAQEAARRLLDERAQKKSERRLPMPGKAVTTSSFVHFF